MIRWLLSLVGYGRGWHKLLFQSSLLRRCRYLTTLWHGMGNAEGALVSFECCHTLVLPFLNSPNTCKHKMNDDRLQHQNIIVTWSSWSSNVAQYFGPLNEKERGDRMYASGYSHLPLWWLRGIVNGDNDVSSNVVWLIEIVTVVCGFHCT